MTTLRKSRTANSHLSHPFVLNCPEARPAEGVPKGFRVRSQASLSPRFPFILSLSKDAAFGGAETVAW